MGYIPALPGAPWRGGARGWWRGARQRSAGRATSRPGARAPAGGRSRRWTRGAPRRGGRGGRGTAAGAGNARRGSGGYTRVAATCRAIRANARASLTWRRLAGARSPSDGVTRPCARRCPTRWNGAACRRTQRRRRKPRIPAHPCCPRGGWLRPGRKVGLRQPIGAYNSLCTAAANRSAILAECRRYNAGSISSTSSTNRPCSRVSSRSIRAYSGTGLIHS